MINIINLTCPRCGAAVSTKQKECEYCHSPIIIEDLSCLENLDLKRYIKTYTNILNDNENNEEVSLSLAICYLKLRLYDKAIDYFDKLIESNVKNSDIYFYHSIALLKGKKPFLAPMANIEKIIELLNAAIILNEKGIYHYFLSYVKYDFYKRKFLNIEPDYIVELNNAKNNNITNIEIENLFLELGQVIPEDIRL